MKTETDFSPLLVDLTQEVTWFTMSWILNNKKFHDVVTDPEVKDKLSHKEGRKQSKELLTLDQNV